MFDGLYNQEKRARRKGYSNTFSALSSLSTHTLCSHPSQPGKVEGRDEATTRLSHHHPHPRNVRLASSKARLCRFAPRDMPENLLRSLKPKPSRCRAVPNHQSHRNTSAHGLHTVAKRIYQPFGSEVKMSQTRSTTHVVTSSGSVHL